jgi:hypothetical protein
LQTTREPWQIREQIVAEIAFLSGVAKANGSLVSLKDLAALTSTNLSEELLRSSWETIPELAASYELSNGLILQRGNDDAGNGRCTVDVELEKRARAENYARYAREFALLCNGIGTNLFAISGSTSYKTPSASDDLDIFCITKPDHLWLFIARSLLLARFLQVFRRDFPRICFSYAVDAKFAEKEFLLPRDALFARDALTTIVVYGQEYYKQLLKKSHWISDYFPCLYRHRTSVADLEEGESESVPSSPGRIFLNTLLRVLVGNYVALKSAMLNGRLRKQGKVSALFSAKIGLDHCIFESVRYSKLRAMYLKLSETARLIEREDVLPT